jgi:TetR/AcrR family transcriptional regulator, cholesterol catabolism regulator
VSTTPVILTPSAPRKSEVTFSRVVDAAARVLSQKGYVGATLSDIAEAAGMKAGSLYYHFSSREALVEEVLLLGTRRVIDAMEHAIARCPLGATWREKIQAAAIAHMSMALQQDDYTAATLRIFAQVPSDIRSKHRIYQEVHGRIWRNLLRGAADAGEIRNDLDLTVTRLLLIGSMNWSIEWFKPGKMKAEDIANQLVATFFDGIKPKSAARQGFTQ